MTEAAMTEAQGVFLSAPTGHHRVDLRHPGDTGGPGLPRRRPTSGSDRSRAEHALPNRSGAEITHEGVSRVQEFSLLGLRRGDFIFSAPRGRSIRFSPRGR